MSLNAAELREIANKTSQDIRWMIEDAASDMIMHIMDRLGDAESIKEGQESDEFALIRQEVESQLSQYFQTARIEYFNQRVV